MVRIWIAIPITLGDNPSPCPKATSHRPPPFDKLRVRGGGDRLRVRDEKC